MLTRSFEDLSDYRPASLPDSTHRTTAGLRGFRLRGGACGYPGGIDRKVAREACMFLTRFGINLPQLKSGVVH